MIDLKVKLKTDKKSTQDKAFVTQSHNDFFDITPKVKLLL